MSGLGFWMIGRKGSQMNIKAAIKRWMGITALELEIDHLRQIINAEQARITKRISELDDLTREDVDVGVRGPCMVVLTGVYRGKGYVRFYDVQANDFQGIVETFKFREKNHLVRNVDAPYFLGGSFDIRR